MSCDYNTTFAGCRDCFIPSEVGTGTLTPFGVALMKGWVREYHPNKILKPVKNVCIFISVDVAVSQKLRYTAGPEYQKLQKLVETSRLSQLHPWLYMC